MKINGLDIFADYQEQAQYGKLINWPLLKSDPLNLRFIWIKCSEGLQYAYYVEGAARCVRGATSVKFEAVNPYHFYLYQWCDWSSGAPVWRIYSATGQATTFYNGAKAANFPAGCHPMPDLEDPLIDQFLKWTDTASANRAIAFARALNAHIKIYLQAIDTDFGVAATPYSGKWWLDKWVPLLINNGYASEVAWIKERYWILADYDGVFSLPSYIPPDHVLAWQKTSSPVPYVLGIPTGRVVPGDALDIDEWMQSEAKFNEYCGKQETPAMIYNTNVKQAERATILNVTVEDKHIDLAAAKSHGTDAVMIQIGGMDGPTDEVTHLLHFEKDFFQTYASRAAEAGLPVLAQFQLRAGYYLDLQIPAPTADAERWWESKVFTGILNTLRTQPWTQSTMLATDGGWTKFHAVVLDLFDMTDKNGNAIQDTWQKKCLEYTLRYFLLLKGNGQFPAVPIIIQSWPGFLASYPGELQNYLYGVRQQVSVGLSQIIYDETPGPQLTSLQILWDTYRPLDTFKFGSLPYGYYSSGSDGLVVFHNYTRGRFGVPEITDNLGKSRLADCSLWCDAKEELYKFLNFSAVIPIPPPTTDLELLTARVKVLEDKLAAIKTVL